MSYTGFNRATYTETLEKIKADFESRIPGADAHLETSFLYILAHVLSGGHQDLLAYIDWIADQTNVLHADGNNLDLWGDIWGVSRKQASKATGSVTITGQDGSVIPAGTQLQRSDKVKYLTTESKTVATGSATVGIEAQEAGDEGNAEAGTKLALTSPIAGITSQTTVVSLTGGADTEADGEKGTSQAYRGRILSRINLPPHGGAEHDYQNWALEVPGVTRAWVYPTEGGSGTVTIRIMMDDAYPDGIPQSADVAQVQAYIDDLARRPVTAAVGVVAPTPVALDVTISSLSADTPETRAAIEAELVDMLRRVAEPGKTIPISKIWEAISIAAGEDNHLVMSPVTNVTHETNEIAVLGTITYT